MLFIVFKCKKADYVGGELVEEIKGESIGEHVEDWDLIWLRLDVVELVKGACCGRCHELFELGRLKVGNQLGGRLSGVSSRFLNQWVGDGGEVQQINEW